MKNGGDYLGTRKITELNEWNRKCIINWFIAWSWKKNIWNDSLKIKIEAKVVFISKETEKRRLRESWRKKFRRKLFFLNMSCVT